MIVSRPKRSTRWPSSIGVARARPPTRHPSAGMATSTIPTVQSAIRAGVGTTAAIEHGHRGDEVLVPAHGRERRVCLATTRVPPVHDPDVDREERERHRSQRGVAIEAVADRERHQCEQQHLHDHEEPVHGVVDPERVHVERGGHPNEPHRDERCRHDADHRRLRMVADRIAERDHRGREHEVVEQLEPVGLPRLLDGRARHRGSLAAGSCTPG